MRKYAILVAILHVQNQLGYLKPLKVWAGIFCLPWAATYHKYKKKKTEYLHYTIGNHTKYSAWRGNVTEYSL